jgi:hypothetical protein
MLVSLFISLFDNNKLLLFDLFKFLLLFFEFNFLSNLLFFKPLRLILNSCFGLFLNWIITTIGCHHTFFHSFLSLSFHHNLFFNCQSFFLNIKFNLCSCLLSDSISLHFLFNNFLLLDSLFLLNLSFSKFFLIFFFLSFLNSFFFFSYSLFFYFFYLSLFIFNCTLLFFDDFFIFYFSLRIEFSRIFNQSISLFNQNLFCLNISGCLSLKS